MAFEIGSVIARVKADTSEFQNGIKEVSGGMGNLSSVAMKVGGVLAGVFAVSKITEFGKEILTQAGNFEQYLTGFEVLLGSMEKAKNLMGDLTEFAKKTPFRLEEVALGAKQLLAYGFAQEDVVSNMKMLGNVASALKVPMSDMVYLYGTLRAQGRAYTKDIQQFAMRGLPIWDMLAEKMGMSVEEVGKAVEEGKVTFETVSSAMNTLAGENGKWGDMMDKQSGTLLGKLSNLQDAWQQFQVTLGNVFLPVAIQVVDWATNLITQIQGLIGSGVTLNSIWGDFQTTVSNVILYLQPLITWFVTTILPALQSIWSEIWYFINTVIPPLVTIVTWLINTILIPLFTAFANFWVSKWQYISAMLKGAWDMIVGIIQVASAVVLGAITVLLNLITGNWKAAWDAVLHYGNIAWEGIKNIFDGAINFLRGWGGWVYDALTEPFRNAWNTIQDLVKKIKDALDFTKRHSPSVVDIVERGVGMVNRALDGLTVGIEPIDTTRLSVGATGGAVNNININLAGAYIGDEFSATRMGEMVGDSIIRQLQKNVRF